ncbi:bifunctional diaminohydroxyphosphoribosylaminopyrimidine deaminase/5-amino-6-(5-phosphoribosylamino)uracil reductase RibD [Alteromonas flava]|uniref:bifunctional diaminohydroxyphosphoribosylaminopyrimidine deaminase/5-amino-6-(5-phosphoribosylamino)uracil reductase RibD n=1 Tax=Alteromonas flava TaxID=2048003 RepID=UPI000C28AA71|nr:bifunctional diaminohydroxyphosphoribosylaminopyrimidine deaminase/5-amino-6-(5-phosphoribosylamino)uracil reductase RibD [Alteromonas flava]
MQSRVVDTSFMLRAVELARLGQYTTAPNPCVGCVIVNGQGDIVGEGFHQQAGTPHAEVHALRAADTRARGATAYVTLEPCSHHGRTGPCADALVEAGISRVVVAVQDPNPLVAGQGIAKLQAAGIEVSLGIAEPEATAINRGFIKRMLTGRPFVTLKLAASVDGRTALKNGQSQWITGPEARRDVHIQRAKHCAILTGADTVLVDDPQLTVRVPTDKLYPKELQHLPQRQPTRVIIDSKNRLHSQLQIMSQEGQTIVANCTENSGLAHLAPAQVLQWQIAKQQDYLDLPRLLTRMGQAEFNSVWLECGHRLAGAMLSAGLVDEIIVYQAPKLMGHQAQSLIMLPDYDSMQQVPEFNLSAVERLGNDLKLVLKQYT